MKTKKIISGIILSITLSVGFPVSSFAEATSISETASFELCLATIQRTASRLGVAPANIVETEILRMVRFPTNDGTGESILVTCSKLDQKMVITHSKP